MILYFQLLEYIFQTYKIERFLLIVNGHFFNSSQLSNYVTYNALTPAVKKCDRVEWLCINFKKAMLSFHYPKNLSFKNIDMGPSMTSYNIPLNIIFVVAAKKYYNLSLRVITPNRQQVFKSHLMVLTHLSVMNCENLPQTQKIEINTNVQGVAATVRYLKHFCFIKLCRRHLHFIHTCTFSEIFSIKCFYVIRLIFILKDYW